MKTAVIIVIVASLAVFTLSQPITTSESEAKLATLSKSELVSPGNGIYNPLKSPEKVVVQRPVTEVVIPGEEPLQEAVDDETGNRVMLLGLI